MTTQHPTGRGWFPGGATVRTLPMRMAGTPYQLVAMAILVGAGAGLAAVAFRWLISAATLHLYRNRRLLGQPRPPGPSVAALAGRVLRRPGPGGRRPRCTDPWSSASRPRPAGTAFPKSCTPSASTAAGSRAGSPWSRRWLQRICIGSGGSVGREGPIVQIGSALGSWLARVFRMPESRVRTLVACGAAGGIAATFNAPIAGVFFALELILADFAARILRCGGPGLGHSLHHRAHLPGQRGVPEAAALHDHLRGRVPAVYPARPARWRLPASASPGSCT